MRIRKMKIEDIKEVKEKFFYGKAINELTIKSKYVYIAIQKNEIIGMLYADATKTKTGILFGLEVIKSYRKKGVASKLLNKLEKDYKRDEIDGILVFYNKNQKLDLFYSKYGFVIGDNLDVACKLIK